MRGRLLVGLPIIVITVAGAATFLAPWGSGLSRGGVVTVSLTGLNPGKARAVTVSLPNKKRTTARVFLVRRRNQHVAALLGISTHLGCRLLLPGDPRYGEGFAASHAIVFEDPCGGSTFALNGDCIGGPCPRGLDRYAVDVHDDLAEIDLNHLIRGTPRGT